MSFAASIRMSESDSLVYSMTPIVSAIRSARASSLRLFSDRFGPSMMLTARSIPNTLFFLSSGGIASPYSSLPCPERRLRGTGPREPDDRDRVIMPAKIQTGGHKPQFQSAAQRVQRASFQTVQEHVTGNEAFALC